MRKIGERRGWRTKIEEGGIKAGGRLHARKGVLEDERERERERERGNTDKKKMKKGTDAGRCSWNDLTKRGNEIRRRFKSLRGIRKHEGTVVCDRRRWWWFIFVNFISLLG